MKKKKVNIWNYKNWKVSKQLDGLTFVFGMELLYIIIPKNMSLTNVTQFDTNHNPDQNNDILTIFDGRVLKLPNILNLNITNLERPTINGVQMPVPFNYKTFFGDLKKREIHGRFYTFFLTRYLKFRIRFSQYKLGI